LPFMVLGSSDRLYKALVMDGNPLTDTVWHRSVWVQQKDGVFRVYTTLMERGEPELFVSTQKSGEVEASIDRYRRKAELHHYSYTLYDFTNKKTLSEVEEMIRANGESFVKVIGVTPDEIRIMQQWKL
jgi:hypothetical protein